jgi:hypothetical protein
LGERATAPVERPHLIDEWLLLEYVPTRRVCYDTEAAVRICLLRSADRWQSAQAVPQQIAGEDEYGAHVPQGYTRFWDGVGLR